MNNIFAFTENNPEQPTYPGFVSINLNDAGDVVVTVRASSTVVDGTVAEGKQASFTVPANMWSLV